MTLHIHMIYDTPRHQLQAETHRKLRMELEEETISRQQVTEHNERIRQRRSAPYYVD